MIFLPRARDKIISRAFPSFQLGGTPLTFVNDFKYLGHQISCDLSYDLDIRREIGNMFL